MKALLKKWLKSDMVLTLLTVLMAYYIKLVYATSRITLVIDAQAKPFMDGEQNAIFCFWHGQLLMQPCIIPQKRAFHVLISHHTDGELIARVVRHFNVDTVRGSSSKGASAALREMVHILDAGNNIGITPDGPRGPDQVAALGAAQLAKISKKPLIPVSYAASRFKRMRSWDRFMVPFPFARITYHIGAPIALQGTGKGAVEQTTELLQTTMRSQTEKSEMLEVGQ